MRTDIRAPDILHALAALFAQPAVQIVVALLGPILLLAMEAYFRTRGKPVARDVDAAFASDPRLASLWRDLQREYTALFDAYTRGRRRHGFRVNRKSDWRFDQRRHAAAEANRDLDSLFARFHERQHATRRRLAIWKWHAAGAGAADVGALAYVVALSGSLLLFGATAAFAIASALALVITTAVWIGYALALTPGEQRRIVATDITWEALAHAHETSEDGAEF
jgi:hypothetical protein